MNRLIVAAGILAFAVCAPCIAESRGPSAPPSSDSDRAAVVVIVQDAVTDAKLCEFAIEKSPNPDVRSYCRTVAVESERIAVAGMQLASALGAADASLDPAPVTAEMIDRLSHASARDFDRSLLLSEIAFDGNNAHVLRYGIEFAENSALKRYEGWVLATLGHHLDNAEILLRRLSETQP